MHFLNPSHSLRGHVLLLLHPTDEETEAERSGNLLNVTPLVGLNSQHLKISLAYYIQQQPIVKYSDRVASPEGRRAPPRPLFPLSRIPRKSQEVMQHPHFPRPALHGGQPSEAEGGTGGSDVNNARQEFCRVGNGRRSGRLGRLRLNVVFADC